MRLDILVLFWIASQLLIKFLIFFNIVWHFGIHTFFWFRSYLICFIYLILCQSWRTYYWLNCYLWLHFFCFRPNFNLYFRLNLFLNKRFNLSPTLLFLFLFFWLFHIFILSFVIFTLFIPFILIKFLNNFIFLLFNNRYMS